MVVAAWSLVLSVSRILSCSGGGHPIKTSTVTRVARHSSREDISIDRIVRTKKHFSGPRTPERRPATTQNSRRQTKIEPTGCYMRLRHGLHTIRFLTRGYNPATIPGMVYLALPSHWQAPYAPRPTPTSDASPSGKYPQHEPDQPAHRPHT
jgi:hypothetical protein